MSACFGWRASLSNVLEDVAVILCASLRPRPPAGTQRGAFSDVMAGGGARAASPSHAIRLK